MAKRNLTSTEERNAWLAEAIPASTPFKKLDLAQYPTVHWNDGTPVSAAAIAALLRSDDPDAVAQREDLLREVDAKSMTAFLVKLIPLIGSARRDLDDSIHALVEYWGDNQSLTTLGNVIRQQLQTGKTARALDALATLSRCRDTEAALNQVDYFVSHASTPAVKEAAMNALVPLLKNTNRSFREIRDENIPTLGFDIRGPKLIDLGSQKLSARVLTDFSLELRNDKDKVIKSIPAARKGDDANARGQAADWLFATRKELKPFVADQSARLEEAMIADLTWPATAWKTRYLERPLLAQLGRRILWTAKRNRLESGIVFRIAEDYTLADDQDNEFHLDDAMNISIAYPLGWKPTQRLHWRTIIEDYAITPLFSQADREVFVPTEEEFQSNSINRFFGNRIDHRSLKNRFKRSGWNIGRFRDAFPWCLFHFRDFLPSEEALPSMRATSLVAQTIRAVCFHDRVFATTDYSQDMTISLSHLTFAPANEIDLKDARETLEQIEIGSCFLPIISVPPRVFSETMRDLTRLIGESPRGDESSVST